jgi:integrase
MTVYNRLRADDQLYSRNKFFVCMKHMMRWAEVNGYAEKMDWSQAKKDKEPKGRLVFYTIQEMKKLLKVMEEPWRTVTLLGAKAGLRRSEIAWLEWQDIDFERNRIHILPKEGWNPKDYERRWIPLDLELREHLEALPRNSKYVCTRQKAKIDPFNMSQEIGARIKLAGLPGVLHSLRHTFGAHLASAGVPLAVIAKLMGHASVRQTEVYAHLSPDAIEDAIPKLPGILVRDLVRGTTPQEEVEATAS